MPADPRFTPAVVPEDAPGTADEQRNQVARPNRNIALLLVGAVVAMLAAAFAVALLVVYGGF